MDVRNYRLVYGRVLCEQAVLGAGLLRMPDDFVEAFDELANMDGIEVSVHETDAGDRVWVFGAQLRRVSGGPNVLSVDDLALTRPTLEQEGDVRDMLRRLPMAILSCGWLRPLGVHIV
jgi:hypothetical protein